MRRTVQDVMTREVVAVRGPTPFKELVWLLNEHRVTAMPVLDDAGRLVIGVVSETDLALEEVAPLREAHAPAFPTAQDHGERAKAASLTAAELMTAPAVTVGPEELVALKVFLRSDDELRFDILDHVIGDLLHLPPGTVEVEVGDGVVRLTGRVPRRSQALAMEKLTGAVDGVVVVESALRWQAEDTATEVPPAEPASLG